MTIKELKTALARIIKFLSALAFLWDADEMAVATSLRNVAGQCHDLANRIDDAAPSTSPAVGSGSKTKGQ